MNSNKQPIVNFIIITSMVLSSLLLNRLHPVQAASTFDQNLTYVKELKGITQPNKKMSASTSEKETTTDSLIKADAQLKAQALQTYGQLSLSFIANQGQLDEPISYYALVGRQSFGLGPESATIRDAVVLKMAPPPLDLNKSAPTAVLVGAPISYTLTISNSSGITLTNVVITDVIPAQAYYVSGGSNMGGVVSWTIPSLADGAISQSSFVVTATETITNKLYRVSSQQGYSITKGIPVTTIMLENDLSMTKSGPVSSTAGAPITYTLTVTNSGIASATNLVITDAVPPGVNFVTASHGGILVGGQVVSWTVPSLAANGGHTQVTFGVTASQSLLNYNYGVVAEGGYAVLGSQPVVTRLPHSCEAYPLALPTDVVSGLDIGANTGIIAEGLGPTTFGWLLWDPANNSASYMLSALQNPALSLTDFWNPNDASDRSLSSGDHITGNSGVALSSAILNEWNRLKTEGTPMRVVVWNTSNGSGPSLVYQAERFILVQIRDFQLNGPTKWINLTYLGEIEDPEICRNFGLSLTPDVIQAASPGQVISYSHSLTNLGNYTETAELSYSSTQPWDISLLSPMSVTLGAGQQVTVTTVMTIPLGLSTSISNVTAITASLSVKPDISASVLETTTVSLDYITGLIASNDSPTWAGQSTTLSATVSSGDNISYTWSLGDGALAFGQTVNHTYACVGSYSAQVTATNIYNSLTSTTVSSLPAIIPTGGGTLCLTPGVTLTAESGVFSATVLINYTPQPITPTGTLSNVALFYSLNATYLSNGLSAQPQSGQVYTITVTYRQDDVLAGINESDLALYYWNGAWIKEASSVVDVVANTISAPPDHFSLWAVLAENSGTSDDDKKLFLPLILKE